MKILKVTRPPKSFESVDIRLTAAEVNFIRYALRHVEYDRSIAYMSPEFPSGIRILEYKFNKMNLGDFSE